MAMSEQFSHLTFGTLRYFRKKFLGPENGRILDVANSEQLHFDENDI